MSHDNINIDQLLERIKLLEEENARLKATPDLVDVGCNTDGRGDDVCPTVDSDEDAKWFPLKNYENEYEIWNCYPYPIRKKATGRIVTEFKNKTSGYIQVSLNGSCQQKHRLVALQFIYNDDPVNKTIVDHIEQDRTYYHVSCLRWVSTQDNNKNRSSTRGIVYEYFDDIDEDAIVVNKYGDHLFENYYYFDNKFYYFNGVRYRELYIKENKSGVLFVSMKDTKNRTVNVYVNKFKKIYNLN